MTTGDLHLLDNIVWHALSGAQSRFAVGEGATRRYAPGFSPIIGFEDVTRPDFAAIAPFCKPGEQFYTDAWSGPVPEGWKLEVESTMDKMVWKGAMPDEDETLPAVPLTAAHAEQALALAMLTRPGPFGIRTIELGDYFGIFEGERLIAMAGERMQAETLREISGVCTHPEAQGRGLAKRLMLELIRRQMRRGQTPFLHVVSTNTVARDLYLRMGFATYKVSPVRVITPLPTPSAELKGLFDADQAAHASVPPMTDPSYAALRRDDAERRRRAAALIASLTSPSPEDLYHAAWLFNHGDQPEEADLAQRWAREAAERGHAPARWLSAAAHDRSRMYRGLPQKYGTQMVPDGKRHRVWDVEPGTTDAERAALDVPPLAEQLARAESLTRSEPQPPMDQAPDWLKQAVARWTAQKI